MTDFLTAAHLILGTPFVGGLAFLITCAVVWVCRVERTAPGFDAHVDQALSVAEPTPIGDSVARDLSDLWAVETVDDCVWLWGDRRP
jgi:hypothetical protein